MKNFLIIRHDIIFRLNWRLQKLAQLKVTVEGLECIAQLLYDFRTANAALHNFFAIVKIVILWLQIEPKFPVF